MSLVAQAEADLSLTLEATTDFGEAFTLTDPADAVGNLIGQFSKISQVIDPDTGVQVSGNFIQATARISSIIAEGLAVPVVGIEDDAKKPWRVIKAGTTFKVFLTQPDEKLGILSMILEPYDG